MLFFTRYLLATPQSDGFIVTSAIRSSLLATLIEDRQSLFISGLASAFVALVAWYRLHQYWAIVLTVSDLVAMTGRLTVVQLYAQKRRLAMLPPEAWVRRYAPFSLLACLLLGVGPMLCVVSGDSPLTCLSVMVTAGILGGVASRNAAIPRLAVAQITLGTLPIAAGALTAHDDAYWILVPPLALYLGAMTTIVHRHYRGLIALMAAEQANAELAARFDAALTYMPHGLFTTDDTGKVIVANKKAAELFGATVESLRLHVSLPEFVGYVGLPKFGEVFRRELVDRCVAWLAVDEKRLDLKLMDGSHLEMTRNQVPDGSAVFIIEDVTLRRRNDAALLHRSQHDELTGLANRRFFSEQVERMVDCRSNEKWRPFAVMYLDLDGFKQVNDRLGHSMGDAVLVSAAELFQNNVRVDDVVARLGGDEFAIVLPDVCRSEASNVAAKLIAEFSHGIKLADGRIIEIGVSIGIAMWTQGSNLQSLAGLADAALYEAKIAGKGRYCFSREVNSNEPVGKHAGN